MCWLLFGVAFFCHRAQALGISDSSCGTRHKPGSNEACASQLWSLCCRAWKPVYTFSHTYTKGGFPGDTDSKESACNVRDPGSIPGSSPGRSPGEGNGHPLQYSCLENSMDRGAWQATVPRAAKSWTQLSN